MVWIIVWAGLLIVVLYSPIGSPGYYSSIGNYYVVSQPVTLTNGTTLNTPKANSSEASNSDELIIPDANLTSKTSTVGGRNPSGNATSGGSSYGSMQTKSYQNSNGGTGGMSGGGSFIASGGSRSSAGTSGIIMTNGITTLSLTSEVSTATSRQGAKAGDPPTFTDPGRDPDLSTQIPVGDGWGLLVLFGACYVAFKKRCIIERLFKSLLIKKK